MKGCYVTRNFLSFWLCIYFECRVFIDFNGRLVPHFLTSSRIVETCASQLCRIDKIGVYIFNVARVVNYVTSSKFKLGIPFYIREHSHYLYLNRVPTRDINFDKGGTWILVSVYISNVFKIQITLFHNQGG